MPISRGPHFAILPILLLLAGLSALWVLAFPEKPDPRTEGRLLGDLQGCWTLHGGHRLHGALEGCTVRSSRLCFGLDGEGSRDTGLDCPDATKMRCEAKVVVDVRVGGALGARQKYSVCDTGIGWAETLFDCTLTKSELLVCVSSVRGTHLTFRR